MSSYSNPVDFLQDEFIKRRQKNPAYSLRAFARSMEISPARLSQVMNQKRALTDGQLKKLAVAFSQNRIIDENLPLWRSRLNKKHKATLACRPQKKYEELRLDQLKLVSDWYHSAIICLLEIPAQEPVTETWIANRLAAL